MDPLTLPGKLESLSPLGKYVLEAAAAAGLDKRASYRLRLAVDEIATNIITHGYEEAGRQGEVYIEARLAPETLTILLEDSAIPFDPCTKAARPEQIDLPMEERPIGGLGVYLTLQGVDEFQYEYVNERNRNIFIMKRPG